MDYNNIKAPTKIKYKNILASLKGTYTANLSSKGKRSLNFLKKLKKCLIKTTHEKKLKKQ